MGAVQGAGCPRGSIDLVSSVAIGQYPSLSVGTAARDRPRSSIIHGG